MTKIKYNGQKLQPITKRQIFDPPKEMLVWDSGYDEPIIKPVCAITSRNPYSVITDTSCFEYCAEIPEEPKPKRATNLQLIEWLAKGNGVCRVGAGSSIRMELTVSAECEDKVLDDAVKIRPFGTTEWVEPTLENMGMQVPVPVGEKL